MVRSNPARRRPKKRPTYGDNTNNQQTEARQENGGDEVTRYLPLIQQLKAFPAISSDVGEDLHVDEPMLAQTISLNSTINGLNNMEIGDGDGITIPQPFDFSPAWKNKSLQRSTTGFRTGACLLDPLQLMNQPGRNFINFTTWYIWKQFTEGII
ncbi:hypothetical protein NC652_020733 [Populus alba x Populus x berolinensis]|nr:hypothetical protein NC652_020733 [Populus alba x Populus x berolinensis]